MMHVPQEHSLMRNTTFKRVLYFGILCCLVSVVVRSINAGQLYQCVDNSMCPFSSDIACVSNGIVYCCGDYRSEMYSCGNNQSDCDMIGGVEYQSCIGFIVTEWILFGLAFASFVGLIILARKHRMDKLRRLQYQNSVAQNIIYSDRMPNAINYSVSSQEQYRQ